MSASFVIDGVAGWVALSLPLVLLMIVAIRVARQGRDQTRTPQPRPAAPDMVRAYGSSVEPSPAAPLTPPPLPAQVATLFDDTAARRAQLIAQVAGAEAAGTGHALPQLYLALARLELASGAGSEAVEYLRKCVLLSASLNLPVEHAAARLELGDIARQTGDTTTACEHWQIARSLFQDAGRASDRDAATARMQRNGCPSDWVLNQF
jgi:tetratricopeptide (TPR) repeat protein